jgi:hypothetical protein
MKKVILSSFLILLTALFFNKMVFAENLSYPFDTITIIEAQKFEIVIPEGVSETSLLYGKVETGQTITVFIANIVLQEIESTQSSNSLVLIMTNDQNEDVIRFLINNMSQDIGVEIYYGFASHILIDSTMGVYKDMTLIENIQEISIHHDIINNQITLTDNVGMVIPMVVGTYEIQTNLNIVISVNTGT